MRTMMVMMVLLLVASSVIASGYNETVGVWKTLIDRADGYEKQLQADQLGSDTGEGEDRARELFCREQTGKRIMLQCDKETLSFLVNDTTRLIFSRDNKLVSARVNKDGIIETYVIGGVDVPSRYEATDGEATIAFDLHRELRKQTKFSSITGKGFDYLQEPSEMEWLTTLYFLDYEAKGVRLDAFARRILLDWQFRADIKDKWQAWKDSIMPPMLDAPVLPPEPEFGHEIPIPTVPEALPGGAGWSASLYDDGLTDEEFVFKKIKECWQASRLRSPGLLSDRIKLNLIYSREGNLITAEILQGSPNSAFAQTLMRLVRQECSKMNRRMRFQTQFEIEFALGDVQDFSQQD